MNATRVLLLLTLGATPFLTGCGADEPTFDEVVVVASDYNGWDRDHVPSREEHRLAPVVGEAADVDCFGVRLTVDEVDGDRVVLRSDERLGEGSSHLDLTDTFEVRVGEETRFTSATTDAGCTYVATLV